MDDLLIMRYWIISVSVYLKDVEPNAEHGIGLEMLHQGNLIDHRPPACVHKNRILLHDGQPLRVYEMVSGLVQHRMQTYLP